MIYALMFFIGAPAIAYFALAQTWKAEIARLRRESEGWERSEVGSLRRQMRDLMADRDEEHLGACKPGSAMFRLYQERFELKREIEAQNKRVNGLLTLPYPEMDQLRRQVADLSAERDALMQSLLCRWPDGEYVIDGHTYVKATQSLDGEPIPAPVAYGVTTAETGDVEEAIHFCTPYWERPMRLWKIGSEADQEKMPLASDTASGQTVVDFVKGALKR